MYRAHVLVCGGTACTVSNSQSVYEKMVEEIKKAAMGGEAESLIAKAAEVNGVKLIAEEFSGYSVDDLRNLSDDIKAAAKNTCMVFAAANGGKVTFLVSLTDDLVEKGFHAGKMIKEIAAAAGGGGGGKANMAQAGAKDSSKIKDAFAVAEKLLS